MKKLRNPHERGWIHSGDGPLSITRCHSRGHGFRLQLWTWQPIHVMQVCFYMCAGTCACTTCWWCSAGFSWSHRRHSYGCTLHTDPTSSSNLNRESAETSFKNTVSWPKMTYSFPPPPKQSGILPRWLEAGGAAGLPETAASSLFAEIT